jgi:hypothetical protein
LASIAYEIDEASLRCCVRTTAGLHDCTTLCSLYSILIALRKNRESKFYRRRIASLLLLSLHAAEIWAPLASTTLCSDDGDENRRNHVSSILSKLGVSDRTKAVLYALQNHLV